MAATTAAVWDEARRQSEPRCSETGCKRLARRDAAGFLRKCAECERRLLAAAGFAS
jgi:hypothetical protein